MSDCRSSTDLHHVFHRVPSAAGPRVDHDAHHAAALQTLTDDTVAHGSTLLNIVQQAAGSIGTALMSVVLTAQQKPALTATSRFEAFDISARAFGTTFMVALVRIVATFVPAFFLPRTKHVSERSAAPIALH